MKSSQVRTHRRIKASDLDGFIEKERDLNLGGVKEMSRLLNEWGVED